MQAAIAAPVPARPNRQAAGFLDGKSRLKGGLGRGVSPRTGACPTLGQRPDLGSTGGVAWGLQAAQIDDNAAVGELIT